MSENPNPLRERLVAAHMRTAAVSSDPPPGGAELRSEWLPPLTTREVPPAIVTPPDEPRPRGRRQALVLVGIAVVLAILGLLLNAATSGSPKAKAPGAIVVPTPARTARSTVYDRFERTGAAALGKAETGQAWAIVGAKWSTNGHEASVEADASGKRTIAFATGGADGTVQVRMTKVAAGAGLVFRYRDAYDHWELIAAPKYGTWNLQRVVDGQVTTIGNIGIVGTQDGSTIAVRFSGDEIAVSIGGTEQRVFHDSALQTEDQVGFTALAVSGQPVRLDDFVMNALSVPNASTPTSTESAGG